MHYPNQLTRAQRQAVPVATLMTGARLNKALEPSGFIKDGALTGVEGAKYDFRMSPLVLKASFGTPINLENLPETDRARVTVEPGEVVFVRTIERSIYRTT